MSITNTLAATGVSSADVNIFNATTNSWSTAILSAARFNLAATSLPNHGVAIFAGGDSKSCDVLDVLCVFENLQKRCISL
jgi:hypothetical protein